MTDRKKSRSALRLRAFIIASDEAELRVGQRVTFIVSPSPDMRNTTARTSIEACIAITAVKDRSQRHATDGDLQRMWSFRGRLTTRIEFNHGGQKLVLEVGQKVSGELTITPDQDAQGWMLDSATAYEMGQANNASSARADAYHAALMKGMARPTGGAAATEEGST